MKNIFENQNVWFLENPIWEKKNMKIDENGLISIQKHVMKGRQRPST